MTQASADNSAQSRHWMYGLNVAVLAVVAIVIIAFAMVLTSPIKKKWDLTSNGLYSLSPYTQQLLKQIDTKGDKYELINLFQTGESNQQVQDVLDEYARGSTNITVADDSQSARDVIFKKISDRYASEITPYQDLVGQYDKVSSDLEKFCKLEAANVGGAAQQAGSATTSQQDAALQSLFASAPEALASTKRVVNRSTNATTADWGAAATAIKTTLGDVEAKLALLTNPAQIKDLFSAPVVKYLTDNAARYKAIHEEVKTYDDKLEKLAPLKVQDVLTSVQPDSIVVLGPTSATVISETSVYKTAAGADPNAQGTTSFEGEQAVSSALLGMVQPIKMKVVFVTSSPTHPTTSTGEDGWSDMTDRLKAANFDVLEWAPPAPPSGPDQPPQDPNPPAEGKGVVWIVFPPDPVNPQMAMMGMPPPSPQPVIDAVKRHMAEGGQVLFFADAGAGGAAAIFGGGDDKYAYDELLQPFGIDVESKYTIVHNYPAQGGDRRMYPRIVVTRFSDQAITKPLQGLPTVFMGVSSRNAPGFIGAPTIVTVAKTLPAGVNAEVLVNSPDDADTWGSANFTPTAEFAKGTDLAPPCPMAVASEKVGTDKDAAQRVVVLSSRMLGCNYMLESIDQTQDDNGHIGLVLANPGNGELVSNSVLWLAGYKNMIAVGSKASAAVRIRSISPGMLTTLRFMLYAGIPFAALILGGVVWLFRRR
jgi:hypothetical protein